MKEYVTAYCDLVEERVNQYENTVELEQKVDFQNGSQKDLELRT